ncbi:MAG: exodeoxyribonuclease VII small subunit [Lachnospiraceae bacterium]|nr:exodeoxyribonuclease VII small subunit [Lachnospiraceae bacterium]
MCEKKEPALEALFLELEEIGKKLEAGDVSLEESFQLYQQGMELLKSSDEIIDTIEKKILVLDESRNTHEF